MTRASISSEFSKCYCKYKGRSLHVLFCIKPNITCPTDSRSVLLQVKIGLRGKKKPIKFLILTLRVFSPLDAKWNAHFLKEQQKVTGFPPDIVINIVMLPCERASCTLLKTRKSYVPLFLRQMYKWYLGLRCMQSFEIWFVPWSCCPFCTVAVGGTVVLMSPLVTACISGMLCNTTWLIVDSQNFPWSPQAPFLLFSLPTYYWTSNETGVPGAQGGITAPNCIVQAE